MGVYGTPLAGSSHNHLIYVHDDVVLTLERNESSGSTTNEWRAVGDAQGLHYARLQAAASGHARRRRNEARPDTGAHMALAYLLAHTGGRASRSS